jgi:hypothetical protein
MKRLKRADLKLGSPKVPRFLADVYYDLRDRRLLPLVALVLVAIGAVPFLLGSDPEDAPEPPPGAGPVAALKETASEQSALTVVEAKPGLRDYHQRLRARTPTDPFKQRYTEPVLEGAQLNDPKSTSATKSSSGGGDSISTSPSTTETVPMPSGSSGGAPAGGTGRGHAPAGGKDGGGGDGPKPSPDPVTSGYGVDLRIVRSSGSETSGDRQTTTDVRKRVLPTASLPSKETEVVTYMGLDPKTRKPLFLVSTDVTAVFGEGKCVAGSDRCQLIELDPGMPEVFEYGEAGTRYRITVTNVELVATGHS